MATLRLGYYDSNGTLPDKRNFLDKYHHNMGEPLKNRLQFRDESFNRWRDFRAISNQEIQTIQRFLKDAGFFPHSILDGIFGYGTMSAIRLFQEYVRTIEGKTQIGIPDGIAGVRTHEHINRWKQDGLTATWGGFSTQNPVPDYLQWINRIRLFQSQLINNPGDSTRLLLQNHRVTDTILPINWNTSEEVIHLIGIRRKAHLSSTYRSNDDLFFLLINGLVFTVYGSTDPNPNLANRHDEPYLILGQHRYRFGWHKKNIRDRAYKAMIPFSSGVFVIRDFDNNDAFTPADIPFTLEAPNPTINIHWSGDGRLNYSAGCQVISGKSYLNHLGQNISCHHFAASSYQQLGSVKTKGAYNVLSDLVAIYGQRDHPELYYTLIPEELLQELDPQLSASFFSDILTSLT